MIYILIRVTILILSVLVVFSCGSFLWMTVVLQLISSVLFVRVFQIKEFILKIKVNIEFQKAYSFN